MDSNLNSNLILGDIIVNKINNEQLVLPSTYTYIPTNITSSTIEIPFNDLTDIPITNKQLTCLLNDEIFYPDIIWNVSSITLNLGFTPNESDKINIIYFKNI
jgi:hypothetical protein